MRKFSVIISVLFLSLVANAEALPWPWNWAASASSTVVTDSRRVIHPLPSLGGDASAVSVSGLSAGAYMAAQLHVAYSHSVMGVGVIAGGPWMCSSGDVFRAQGPCMDTPSDVDVPTLVREAKHAQTARQIDALSNLSATRAYIFNSPVDSVINGSMNAKTTEFYANFMPASRIYSETTISSAHGMPTVSYGRACDDFGSPYLIKCGFDAAGELLKFIYQDRAPQLKRATAVSSSLRLFDQTEFGSEAALMGASGWVYIPAKCEAQNSKCPVHVALHGCLQTPDHIKNVYAAHAGYNEWAEGSGIIVLYPQAETSLMNPKGCFDWWGYTGDTFATKQGPQMQVIKAMMDRLTSF